MIDRIRKIFCNHNYEKIDIINTPVKNCCEECKYQIKFTSYGERTPRFDKCTYHKEYCINLSNSCLDGFTSRVKTKMIYVCSKCLKTLELSL